MEWTQHFSSTQLMNYYILFQELYSESHENVCIMFASIPNFKEFYQESAARQCIELLNNIIAKFDQVFFKYT